MRFVQKIRQQSRAFLQEISKVERRRKRNSWGKKFIIFFSIFLKGFKRNFLHPIKLFVHTARVCVWDQIEPPINLLKCLLSVTERKLLCFLANDGLKSPVRSSEIYWPVENGCPIFPFGQACVLYTNRRAGVPKERAGLSFNYEYLHR